MFHARGCCLRGPPYAHAISGGGGGEETRLGPTADKFRRLCRARSGRKDSARQTDEQIRAGRISADCGGRSGPLHGEVQRWQPDQQSHGQRPSESWPGQSSATRSRAWRGRHTGLSCAACRTSDCSNNRAKVTTRRLPIPSQGGKRRPRCDATRARLGHDKSWRRSSPPTTVNLLRQPSGSIDMRREMHLEFAMTRTSEKARKAVRPCHVGSGPGHSSQ